VEGYFAKFHENPPFGSEFIEWLQTKSL